MHLPPQKSLFEYPDHNEESKMVGCSKSLRLASFLLVSLTSETFLDNCNIPKGPDTSTAVTGAYLPLPLPSEFEVCRSINRNDTPAGIDNAADPTRDCAGTAVEKDWWPWKGTNAGKRKATSEFIRVWSSRSGLRQHLDTVHAILTLIYRYLELWFSIR